jgi:hypothetical protein
VPTAISSPAIAMSDASSISANVCHTSVVRKSTTENSISSGIARASRMTLDASCPPSRRIAHATIDNRP